MFYLSYLVWYLENRNSASFEKNAKLLIFYWKRYFLFNTNTPHMEKTQKKEHAEIICGKFGRICRCIAVKKWFFKILIFRQWWPFSLSSSEPSTSTTKRTTRKEWVVLPSFVNANTTIMATSCSLSLSLSSLRVQNIKILRILKSISVVEVGGGGWSQIKRLQQALTSWLIIVSHLTIIYSIH